MTPRGSDWDQPDAGLRVDGYDIEPDEYGEAEGYGDDGQPAAEADGPWDDLYGPPAGEDYPQDEYGAQGDDQDEFPPQDGYAAQAEYGPQQEYAVPGGYPEAGPYQADDEGPFRWQPPADAPVGGAVGGYDLARDDGLIAGLDDGPVAGRAARVVRGSGARPARGGRPVRGGAGARGGPPVRSAAAARGAGPGRGASPGRRRRKSTTRKVLTVAIPLAVLLVIAVIIGDVIATQPNFTGPGTGEVTVKVTTGETPTELAPKLVSLGVVASTGAFIEAVEARPNLVLEPGTFRLKHQMKASEAWAALTSASTRVQTSVLIPEGLRLSQIEAILADKTKFPLSAWQSAAKKVSALGLPSYANGNPEGYLFPATYEVQPGMTPLDVLKAMVTRYNQEAASISLPAASNTAELTENQVITVASLLEAEAGSTKYFSRVAEVIYNRLNNHMMLQLNSTVLFALNSFTLNVTDAMLKVKSPYNTFTHFGLPPGPIDSPGQAAIEAALHPAHGNLLYFVTVNPKTGLTKFTNSAAVFAQLKAEFCKNANITC
jgi:UPF0755 protein